MKFYICRHCGNVIVKIEDSKVPVVCCGEKMEELVVGSVDAALEKHVPVVTVSENKVTILVGSVMHPMTEEHHISWIVLETEEGFLLRYLNPTAEAKVEFMTMEKPKQVYAYCNLHGLWKTTI